MKKNRLLKLAFCFTLFNLSFTGYSQCELNFLEKEYNIGRFEEVNDKLRACLKTCLQACLKACLKSSNICLKFV